MALLTNDNLDQQQSWIDLTLAARRETHDPRHAAAMCYLMRRNIQDMLRSRFCPEDASGMAGKSGIRREIKYLPTEATLPPMPSFVLMTTQKDGVVGVVDLVMHLAYKAEAQSFSSENPVTGVESSREVIPLLVLIRLGTYTVQTAVLEFNIIRQFIQRFATIEPNLYDLFDNRCLLVTEHVPTGPEVDMLHAADVDHLVLGEDFNHFYQREFCIEPGKEAEVEC